MAHRALIRSIREPQRQPVFGVGAGAAVRDRDPGLLWLVRALWKHRVWLAASWVLVTALSWVWIWALPCVYRAEAVILIESSRIPGTVSVGAARTNWQARLNAASWQVLSPSRLPGLVQELGLSPHRGAPPPEVVQRIRESVSIKPSPERGPDRPPMFQIACQYTDPAAAASVANRLSRLLVEEVRRARCSQATSASEFLGGQLAVARQQLEQQEKALSDFRQRYSGELPEQESTVVAALSRLQAESASALENIGRAEQKKILLASALESARFSAAAAVRLAEQSGRVRPAAGVGPGTGAVSSRTEQLQQRLAELLTHCTEGHPDVKRLRLELAKLGEKPAAAVGGPLPPALAPSVVKEQERVYSLRSQLTVAQGEAETLQAKRRRLTAEMDALRGAIGRLPARKREFAALLREYEIANGNYRSLANKKLAAEAAAEMERQQQVESLSVVEEARIPSQPLKPDRWRLGAMGCLGGLLIAVAIALLREVDRHALREVLETGGAEWTLWAGIPGSTGSARRRASGGARRYTSA